MLTIMIIGVTVHNNITHRLVVEAVIIIKHFITILLVAHLLNGVNVGDIDGVGVEVTYSKLGGIVGW